MESSPLGVKKGCWTEEEDILLRKCIDKYGEGKWHLVPQRAGLNRCRKSCRIRWSLIAGRIPGRTSNDVKNYWNSHLRIKPVAPGEVTITTAKKITTETKVIKPRPRRFTNNLAWFSGNTTLVDVNTQSAGDSTLTNPSPLTSSPLKVDDDHILWWDNMVELDMELIDSMGGSDKEVITTSLCTDEVPAGVDIASDSSVQDGKNIGFNDFAVDDLDLWDLL